VPFSQWGLVAWVCVVATAVIFVNSIFLGRLASRSLSLLENRLLGQRSREDRMTRFDECGSRALFLDAPAVRNIKRPARKAGFFCALITGHWR